MPCAVHTLRCRREPELPLRHGDGRGCVGAGHGHRRELRLGGRRRRGRRCCAHGKNGFRGPARPRHPRTAAPALPRGGGRPRAATAGRRALAGGGRAAVCAQGHAGGHVAPVPLAGRDQAERALPCGREDERPPLAHCRLGVLSPRAPKRARALCHGQLRLPPSRPLLCGRRGRARQLRGRARRPRRARGGHAGARLQLELRLP
mmetsp:Transcript_2913/g.10217  ORF Transcript_2913/g.10217 Transcript_2913/m.10217 type:complete len:204 (+) Transcript_2913:397-1008(+)